MILKGNQRASGHELALHLLNVEDNEHAVVHELRGFLSDDLIEAFKETEAISLGTKCQQYLFSLSLNPPKSAKVSIAEFEKVIGEIERRMGLSGQPRAVVFHEKKGRRHAHCVWSRIDVEKMRAINLSHYKLRLAVSIHRSQGCTVDKSYVLSSRTMDKNLTYVALTRHKHETKFYTAPDIASKHLRSVPELFAPRDFRARAPVRSR